MFPVKQLFFFKDKTNLACFALLEFADTNLCYDNKVVNNVMFGASQLFWCNPVNAVLTNV